MNRSPIARVLLPVLTLAALSIVAGHARAQDVWTYIGPDVGTIPEALCVTERALYVGMTDEADTGYGLFRYRFAEGQWALFAFPGLRVTAVSVAGANDERIVAAIYDPSDPGSEVRRSEDGGQTWTMTDGPGYWVMGKIIRAPSDPNCLFRVDGRRSTDDGLTWLSADLGSCTDRWDVTFDPSTSDVLYLTGNNWIELWRIYKSTDGGATFSVSDDVSFTYGIAVDATDPDRVLAVMDSQCRVSTDAGTTWATRGNALPAKMVTTASWARGAFYAVGAGSDYFGVQRTTDLGTTWSLCGQGPPNPFGLGWLVGTRIFVESHPTRPELYVALEGTGVWRLDFAPESVPGPGVAVRGPALRVWPNPVVDWMRVESGSPAGTVGTLRLLDVRGRLVDVLFDGVMGREAGAFEWRVPEDGTVPAGVYYLRLDAGGDAFKRRIVILR